MEIERKYRIHALPANLCDFPSREIEQAYLCTTPVVRVRRDGEAFYLTYKSKGLLAREEYNLPLTEESYAHLLTKADGIVLSKRRYKIPLSAESPLVIELDVFSGIYAGLLLAEVEFPNEQDALAFVPPAWFGEDVTFTGQYQNSRLSKGAPDVLEELSRLSDAPTPSTQEFFV